MTDKMRHTLSSRRWTERNRKKENERSRLWRKNNPEKTRETARESTRRWTKNNLEKVREKAQRWYENNCAKERERSGLWRKNNPEKTRVMNHFHRARKRSTEGTYTAKQFTALCLHFKNHCLKCGRPRKLTADHVIPLVWADRYPDVALNDIDNLQPLCKSCNSSKNAKYVDYRTNPHQHCINPPMVEDYLAA
jgi:HNH endonuclease